VAVKENGGVTLTYLNSGMVPIMKAIMERKRQALMNAETRRAVMLWWLRSMT